MTAPLPTLDEQIRQERANGELLGPLLDKYGAEAVVRACGVSHIACSLGVCDHEEPEDDEVQDVREI